MCFIFMVISPLVDPPPPATCRLHHQNDLDWIRDNGLLIGTI
jgi:hypothetical protein